MSMKEVLEAYFAGNFDPAAELFGRASQLRPDDFGAKSMRECSQALATDPPVELDGIHVMHEK